MSRGDLAARPALAALAELTAPFSACARCAPGPDPYAQLGAIALAGRLDTLVDDATRPAWTAYLVARFAGALRPTSGARRDGRRSAAADEEVAAQLVGLVPAERYPATESKTALAELEAIIADATEELPDDLVSLAAVAGGDKLFTRIVERARTLSNHDLQVSWLGSLGRFGAPQIARAVALLDDTTIAPDAGWAAVDTYFARPAMRTQAWRELRPVLGKIIERMSAAQVPQVIDATASLCDATSRDEVSAAFEPRVKSIPGGRSRLDRALAAIDRCLALRTALGDLAGALAARK